MIWLDRRLLATLSLEPLLKRQIEVRITPINTMLMNGPVCEVQMKVGCCKADYIRLTVRGCVEGKSDLKLCV